MHEYRTHNCSELGKSNIGESVKISGFVNVKRDHGDLLFLDIRDFYGITQCVVEASNNENINIFAKVKLESVVTIEGLVVARGDNAVNKNLATGEVEIQTKTIHIESAAKQIPFQVNEEDVNYPEELRLKNRFLDLRRSEMKERMIMRSKIITHMRSKMVEQGFLEIQTPILTASSPEGARDFLVPSRLNPGKFYALPQAPQQFKQLLMASGFDKYFQVAPCFRDEDSRADRSPGEFYQLDIEMAFVTQQDVFDVIEPVLYNIFKEFTDKKIPLDSNDRFPVITYKDSMLKYGNDKPDLRVATEIYDVTDIYAESELSIFVKNIKQGKIVRAIPCKNSSKSPRSFFDNMIDYAIKNGAKGLAYIIFTEEGEVKSPIAKFLSPEQLAEIKSRGNLHDGDSVFFASDDELVACDIAGKVRVECAKRLKQVPEDSYQFCWIVDYPLYEQDKTTGKIDFSHNPFSMPQGGMDALLNKDPLDILGYQYDIVCNGIELSSGAIRNHKPEVMYKAFEIAGYDKSVVDNKFPALINAFHYGAPPHGGLAPGIERILMMIMGTENIREVVAFPLNGQAQDLLMNAPNTVDPSHLKELSLKIEKKSQLSKPDE
ncbi:MAG: aspartate--tRNA ligase [Rickettsiales bacterium]|jgi:aspartyl-tRNA synthetase|nr:aspartate--tRNA ligase [Rickettsiales bacterium]